MTGVITVLIDGHEVLAMVSEGSLVTLQGLKNADHTSTQLLTRGEGKGVKFTKKISQTELLVVVEGSARNVRELLENILSPKSPDELRHLYGGGQGGGSGSDG